MADLNVPNSPMKPLIGETIEGQSQQAAAVPDDEVTKSPEYKQNLKWLQKPENLMTALVFVGSMMQDRQRGQSKMDAFAERTLGTIGFRGELGRRNNADVMEREKAQSEAGYKVGQIQTAKDRNAIEREGLGVQREQIGATKENTAAQIAGQERMNIRNNETDWQIALLNDRWNRLSLSTEAELRRMKEQGGGFGLTTDQMLDIFKINSEAAASGVTLPPPPEMMRFVMQTKVQQDPALQQYVGYRVVTGPDGNRYIDVKPEYRAALGIPEGYGVAKKPGAAEDTKEPKPKSAGGSRQATRNKLTPEQLRQQRTRAEVEALQRAGGAVGKAASDTAEWHGAQEFKYPKEKY